MTQIGTVVQGILIAESRSSKEKKRLRRLITEGRFEEFKAAVVQQGSEERSVVTIDKQLLLHYALGAQKYEIAEWLLTLEGVKLRVGTYITETILGRKHALEWLHAKGCPWNADVCKTAAKYGHLEVLKWLRSKGCPWNYRTIQYAIHEGHPDIAEWARQNGCPTTKE